MSTLIPGGLQTVTSGSGAFGSWVTMLTPPVPLRGFYIQISGGNNPSGTNQVGLFDVGFGSTPVSILNNGKDVYNNDTIQNIFYPIAVPKGVPISLAANETGGAAGALYAQIIGVVEDGDPRAVRCSLVQNLFPSGGNNNYGPISATAPGTLYGTTLALPARYIHLTFELDSNAQTESYADVGLSFGPSSTAQETILAHNLFGSYSNTQQIINQEYALTIPTAMQVYLLQNAIGGGTTGLYGGIRVFY